MEERILVRASDLGGIFSFTEVLSCVLAAFTSAHNPEDVSPNVHARADRYQQTTRGDLLKLMIPSFRRH